MNRGNIWDTAPKQYLCPALFSVLRDFLSPMWFAWLETFEGPLLNFVWSSSKYVCFVSSESDKEFLIALV